MRRWRTLAGQRMGQWPHTTTGSEMRLTLHTQQVGEKILIRAYARGLSSDQMVQKMLCQSDGTVRRVSSDREDHGGGGNPGDGVNMRSDYELK